MVVLRPTVQDSLVVEHHQLAGLEPELDDGRGIAQRLPQNPICVVVVGQQARIHIEGLCGTTVVPDPDDLPAGIEIDERNIRREISRPALDEPESNPEAGEQVERLWVITANQIGNREPITKLIDATAAFVDKTMQELEPREPDPGRDCPYACRSAGS